MDAMSDRLTRPEVVRVARTLLDDGGLPALGMRRIASELGVQQSALYWHFENKQALLAALADDIVSTVEPAPAGAGPDGVVELCLRLRGELLRHQDGADLVSTAIAFRLGGARVLALLEAALADAGSRPPPTETAAAVLLHYLLGFTNDEQQHRQAVALGAIASDALDEAAATRRFVRGVELIVGGLGATTPSRRHRGASSPARPRRAAS
jgi:TetR/AcrR family tetracycline transcriptional repressor